DAAQQIQVLPADQQDQLVRYLVRQHGGADVVDRTMEGLAATLGSVSMSMTLPPGVLASITSPVGPGPWSPPGRQPIRFYIGNEAHGGIAAEYVAAHLGQAVFTNTISVKTILLSVGIDPAKTGLGGDAELQPDIANVSPSKRHLYEIKPKGSEA